MFIFATRIPARGRRILTTPNRYDTNSVRPRRNTARSPVSRTSRKHPGARGDHSVTEATALVSAIAKTQMPGHALPLPSSSL